MGREMEMGLPPINIWHDALLRSTDELRAEDEKVKEVP